MFYYSAAETYIALFSMLKKIYKKNKQFFCCKYVPYGVLRILWKNHTGNNSIF